MNDNKKMKILVWFDIFDSLISQDYEDRSERAHTLFEDVDCVYATEGSSYRSACEYTYSSKVHKLPTYVNNDEAVKAYAKEKEDAEQIEVITPVDVLAAILDRDADSLEGYFESLTEEGEKPRGTNIADMSKEEMHKQLPGPIANAFQGLTDAIDETQARAGEIISEYMSACDISGIDESQAKEEGQSYMSSEGAIPAAEFICPVNILDKLKQI